MWWYPFIHLGGEKSCESKVCCLRTQHNVSGQGSTRLLNLEITALTMRPRHPYCVSESLVRDILFYFLFQTIWDPCGPRHARGNTLLSTWSTPSSQEHHSISPWGIWILWGISQLSLSIYLLQASVCWSSLWHPVAVCIHDNFQVSNW